MKIVITTLLILGTWTCLLPAQIAFNRKEYLKFWETSARDATMKEYLAGGETTANWSTMLTFQAHPKARQTKEVSEPYYEARQSIVALPPQIHPRKEGDSTDIVLELFLGAPGVTPHLEFVLARFIETDQGVYAAIYSHKIPLQSKKKNQDTSVDDIMKRKWIWIKELLDLPVETIKKEF